MQYEETMMKLEVIAALMEIKEPLSEGVKQFILDGVLDAKLMFAAFTSPLCCKCEEEESND